MKPIYRWLAAVVGLFVVGFLVWYFHVVVFYILASAVLSLMGKPLIQWMCTIRVWRFQIPQWLAAAVTILAMLGVFIGLSCSLVPVVLEKLKFLSTYNIDELSVMLQEPIAEVEHAINSALPSIDFTFQNFIANQIEPFFKSGFIQNTLNSLTVLVADVLMAIFSISFITFYFMKEDKLFNEGLVLLFPKRYEQNIERAVASVTRLLIRYFIGICIESAIKFVFVVIAMYIIGFGMDTAIIIALITAVLNVIPYIGPIIGGLISFVIAGIAPVAGVDFTMLIMEIGLVLLVFQLIDNIILQPYIYSSSVKAHPLEIFIVILMAGYMSGIVGMLFAIPGYTVLRVLAKEFFNNLRVVQRLTEKI